MKSFTESGVLFPDDWENEPEEPAVPPPAPEPKPERKVRDTAARPAPKLASEDEDLDYGTPCFKRADLVDLLCEEHGFDVAESRAFVAEFFDMIFDHLVQGHMVKLSGLGRFSVRYKAPRPAGTPGRAKRSCSRSVRWSATSPPTLSTPASLRSFVRRRAENACKKAGLSRKYGI